jgi:hypothetical protein
MIAIILIRQGTSLHVMKALIVAYGQVNSIGEDRHQPGLLRFGGKEVIGHTLDNIGSLVDETLILSNREDAERYRRCVHGMDYKVKVEAYDGPSDPTYVYSAGLSMKGDTDDVVAIADDNLFLFSLDGLIHTFQEVDSSVMAVRHISDIDGSVSSPDANYGRCLFDKSTGKVIHTSYSFGPPQQIRSDFVALDIYLVHHRFVGELKSMMKDPRVRPDDIIRKSTQSFYAWVAGEGPWWDVGKPHLRRQAEEYFSRIREP